MELKNKIQKLLAFIFLALMALPALAQTNGKILGKVIDKKTGEELIGVTIVIEGTSFGGATDYEGNFIIGNVKPGLYNLIASYVSYSKKTLKGIEVKSGENTSVSISLEESQKELNEVVIQADLKRETASALLIQQKKSTSISDGVSADMIKKTPDATTGDVMKRVSGASIQDNKFAIIRGLNDRYNTAYINGAPLPSSESDRKAFSFDIIPSGLIDNIIVTKSATANLPGDFAGGIVQVTTKDVSNDFFSLGIDSITAIKFVGEIKQKFLINILGFYERIVYINYDKFTEIKKQKPTDVSRCLTFSSEVINVDNIIDEYKIKDGRRKKKSKSKRKKKSKSKRKKKN
jgi:acyl carrier protein